MLTIDEFVNKLIEIEEAKKSLTFKIFDSFGNAIEIIPAIDINNKALYFRVIGENFQTEIPLKEMKKFGEYLMRIGLVKCEGCK